MLLIFFLALFINFIVKQTQNIIFDYEIKKFGEQFDNSAISDLLSKEKNITINFIDLHKEIKISNSIKITDQNLNLSSKFRNNLNLQLGTILIDNSSLIFENWNIYINDMILITNKSSTIFFNVN